jgi:hypothetical protein
MVKVIELKKLEAPRVSEKCKEMGVEFKQVPGYSGSPSYMLTGEPEKIREALSVALDEDELDEISFED